MKRFEVPTMFVQKFEAEDILTDSGCRTEAQGCTSCYCSAVECETGYNACPTNQDPCPTYLDF